MSYSAMFPMQSNNDVHCPLLKILYQHFKGVALKEFLKVLTVRLAFKIMNLDTTFVG